MTNATRLPTTEMAPAASPRHQPDRASTVQTAPTAPAARVVHLLPMTQAMLDRVCAIEALAYPHPWSRGNFVDSILAGYHCVGLFEASDPARLRAYGNAHDGLLGYLVALDGVEETHLLNITVAPAVQGRGHARWMLDALVQRSRASAASSLWLEVRPSNQRAQALYRRYGFESVGLRRNYYPAADGQREDAVVMKLSLVAERPQEGA